MIVIGTGESGSSLDDAVVEQILDRFEIRSIPPSELSGLTELYRAWCLHIPFDNVRKMIALASDVAHELPGMEAGEFFRAWLDDGCGGTCWTTDRVGRGWGGRTAAPP